ncbi:MAG: cupredoxin domain-containing protein [Deltaproteobacteria bacterium]|nr:cupredoxin domain-containing protein [Deltaproteobacteria bacterium]
MSSRRPYIAVAFVLAAFILTGTAAKCAASEITTKFIEAFDANDHDTMIAIVETNKAKVPAEVSSIIEEAQKAQSQDEKESHFYMAEMMAKIYMDSTGDTAPLLEVKRKSFDAKLTASERPAPVDGVYIIELPKAAADTKNVFRPNSIVIKKGSTVRWVNKDTVAHVFASMPVIGKGGISAPMLQPGESWEYKFDKPGEYFYICFIHHAMIGKITVEE